MPLESMRTRRIRPGARSHALAAGVLSALLACAAAAQTAAPAEAWQPYQRWIDGVFTLPPAASVDGGIRAAVDALAREHRQRVAAQLPMWWTDEQAEAGPAASPAAIAQRLYRRLINELSLWQVDTAGPAYDAAMWAAWSTPGLCGRLDHDHPLTRLAQLAEAAPPAQREALFEGQRELLRRWGSPRPHLPPLPEQETLMQPQRALEAIERGQPWRGPAMPPVVAARAMGRPIAQWGDAVQCAVRQWWLRAGAADGAVPAAQALSRMRYAMFARYGRYAGAPARPAGDSQPRPEDYPRDAAYFGVTGRVLVRLDYAAEGRYVGARILRRDLQVEGIRGVRPVAFETLLDDASRARADIAAAASPTPPEPDAEGRRSRTVELRWTLQ